MVSKSFCNTLYVIITMAYASFENITPRPIIPTIEPTKMGSLIGFLKNIKPLKTVKSVNVEKMRQTIPDDK